MPLQLGSSGSNVKSPVEPTVTTLQPDSHPLYVFCQAFMWRQPLPIGSYRSPYSLWTQPAELGSSTKMDVPQVMADECCMPKLWPGSWAMTTQPSVALYQLSLAGRVGVPSWARPAHGHADCCDPRYQR